MDEHDLLQELEGWRNIVTKRGTHTVAIPKKEWEAERLELGTMYNEMADVRRKHWARLG
jgi:hypothetical protein